MRRYAGVDGVDVVALPDEPRGEREAQRTASRWNHWGLTRGQQPRMDEAQFIEQRVVDKARLLVDICARADLFISTSIRSLPWIVARETGIPWITVSLNPIHFAPPGFEGTPARRAGHRRAVAGSRRLARYVLGRLGRPIGQLPEHWHGFRAPTILQAWSPAFSRPTRVGLPRRTRATATGFWFFEDPRWVTWRPDPRLQRVFDSDQRPIVLALSSQPVEHPARLLRAHLAAAQRLERPLVVQRGWAGFSADQIGVGHRDATVVFTGFAPQNWLFARAACAIQHGGPGSLARAIVEGCPLLIEPFGGDQFFNALRVLRLGVGAAIHPVNSTADTIAMALARVLRGACRRRAAVLGAQFRSEPGIPRACAVIDDVLSGSDRSGPGLD
jgi:UDP:flavonoid glycosyltransferase YjiC (YdhE family)